MQLYNIQFLKVLKISCYSIWWNWDIWGRIKIIIYMRQSIYLHLSILDWFLSKKLWALIYVTSTYISELLSQSHWSWQANFFKKVARYRQLARAHKIASIWVSPRYCYEFYLCTSFLFFIMFRDFMIVLCIFMCFQVEKSSYFFCTLSFSRR